MPTQTAMKRTPVEILERMQALDRDDMFGWSRQLLIGYLPFAEARAFLKPEVTEAEWQPATDPVADLVAYLDFAWEKAEGERGISANRSVDKIEQWLWLAGLDELLVTFKSAPYESYGKPQLWVVTAALAPEKLAGR